jgi:hypothetical protein
VVKGICEEIADEATLAHLEAAAPPTWRDTQAGLRWARVRADSVTGRETPNRPDATVPTPGVPTEDGDLGGCTPGRLGPQLAG